MHIKKEQKHVSHYECSACDMAVKALQCAKCGENLEHCTIQAKSGDVAVSQCPSGCGKIKSPMCCGKDMEAKVANSR